MSKIHQSATSVQNRKSSTRVLNKRSALKKLATRVQNRKSATTVQNHKSSTSVQNHKSVSGVQNQKSATRVQNNKSATTVQNVKSAIRGHKQKQLSKIKMRARVRNITLVSKIRKKKPNTCDKNKNLSRYFNNEKLWFFEIKITQGRDWNYFTFTALCNVAARTETQCTGGYKPEIANWENSNVYRVLISSLLDTRNKTVRSPRIM